MITEFGMSEELGPLTFGRKQEQVFLGRDLARDRDYSEEVAYAIDKEARRIIDECYKEAERLLKENIDALHLIAQTLMEKETIDADEFRALLEQAGLGEFIEGKFEQSEVYEGYLRSETKEKVLLLFS